MTARELYNDSLVLASPTSSRLQIRLLALDPSSSYDSPLSGSLSRHLVGTEKLPYAALSYTWGIDKARDVITLNSTFALSISPNLVSALRHIRRTSATTVLWIDAICLNQLNEAEKNSQVPEMGRIYAGAQYTFVWLGEKADGSDEAMDWLSKLSSLTINEETLNSIPQSIWDGVRAIQQRSWWTRVWIIQEVLRSRATYILCGTQVTEFSAFVLLEQIRDQYLRVITGIRNLSSNPFSPVLSMWDQHKRDAASGQATLFQWINTTHKFDQTLPRDRFYAMLGMSMERIKAPEAVTVEYNEDSLSDEELTVQVTVLFLSEYCKLLPLMGCWRKENTKLPTWVPDWCTEQSGWVGFSMPARQGITPYSACGQYTTFSPRFDPPMVIGQIPPLNIRFLIPGLIFDKIIYADAASFSSPRLEKTTAQEAAGRATRTLGIHTKCKAWYKFVQSSEFRSTPYRSQGGIEEAFWRTIIADRLGDWTGPPPPTFGVHFEAWINGDETVDTSRYYLPAIYRCVNRSFFITERGYLGLGPKETALGDIVCILAGGDVPFVLRLDDAHDDDSERCQQFIGQAYVHGIMDGSFVKEYVDTIKSAGGSASLMDFRLR